MSIFSINALKTLIIETFFTNEDREITGDEIQTGFTDTIDSLFNLKYDPLFDYPADKLVLFEINSIWKLYVTNQVVAVGESPVTNPEKYDTIIGDAGVDGIVLSVPDLRAVTGYSQDTQYIVNELNKLFTFSASSTATPDGTTVIKPDDITLPTAGRWLEAAEYVTNDVIGLLSSLATSDKTNIVNAINEVHTIADNKPNLGNTETAAYRGDRGESAYTHSQATGNPHNTKLSEISEIEKVHDIEQRITQTSDVDLPAAQVALDLETTDVLVFRRLNDNQTIDLGTSVKNRVFYVFIEPNNEGSLKNQLFSGQGITSNVWNAKINETKYDNTKRSLLVCEIKQIGSSFIVFIDHRIDKEIFLTASSITNKAEIDASNITGNESAWLVKLGLNNVNNTADADKEVSTPQANAIGQKEGSLGNPDVDGKVLSSTAAGERSWVDPSSGGASYVFKNGLVENSGVVKLGGEFTEDYFETVRSVADDLYRESYTVDSGNIVKEQYVSNGIKEMAHLFGLNEILFSSSDNSKGVVISLKHDKLSIGDTRTVKKGIEYLADYSSDFGDRSIPDVGGVKNLISEPYLDLTPSASISWDALSGLNKKLTRGGDFTLTVNNLSNGMSGDLRLNITSLTTITLPTSLLNGNVTALAAGVYHLTFVYDGTNLDFNIAHYE